MTPSWLSTLRQAEITPELKAAMLDLIEAAENAHNAWYSTKTSIGFRERLDQRQKLGDALSRLEREVTTWQP